MDATRDLVMMRGGRMVMLINGEMLFMERAVIAADGSEVQRDGTVIQTDGTRRILHEDEALVIDLLSTRVNGS